MTIAVRVGCLVGPLLVVLAAGCSGSGAPTKSGGAGASPSGGAAAAGTAGAAGATGPAGAAGAPGTAGAAGGGVASTCDHPQGLALVDGHVTVAGDTSTGSTELAALDCAIRGAGGPLVGRALYYRFNARVGLKYELRLTSHTADPDVLYVFDASTPCTLESIQTACRSGGAGGTATANIGNGALTFRPRTTGDYVVAVDADGFANTTLPGGPFQLGVFEYCDEQITACATQLCSASMPACEGTVATQCNDLGTGTAGARTDCTSTGATCQAGVCRATITDQPGWSGTEDFPSSALASASAGTALDFYTVTQSRTLVQIVQEMKAPAATPLTFVVYEARAPGGAYQNVFSKAIAAAGVDAESSGPISVPLVAGRGYAIGVGWSAPVQYRVSTANSSTTLPQATFFGQLTSAKLFDGAAAQPVSFEPPGTLAFPQGLTTAL